MFVYRVRAIPAATSVAVYQVRALSYMLSSRGGNRRRQTDSRNSRKGWYGILYACLGDKQGVVHLGILHVYGILLRQLFFVAAVLYSGS